MARVAVFGAGYVGLVTGACLADLGHRVTVRDVLPKKIDALRRGRVPIYEPGLDDVIARAGGRLTYTLDVGEALDGAEFLFVCVGTPSTYSGDADLSAIWTVVDELASARPDAVVVMKSTVPVGTGEKVRAALDGRGLEGVGYVSNPEFTAEGSAVSDFMRPDRIVIGAFEPADGEAVEALHGGIDAPVLRTDVNSAEMVKLASNAFLSTRISFVNEIANVCELVGADVEDVARGMGLDHRLGPHFLRAGVGFGGSCLAGREHVFVREGDAIRLTTLERLYASLVAEAGDEDPSVVHPTGLDVLAWQPGEKRVDFYRVAAATRRWYSGEARDVKANGRGRIRCTPDHPFITHGVDGEPEVVVASRLRLLDAVPTTPVSRLKLHRYPRLVPAGVSVSAGGPALREARAVDLLLGDAERMEDLTIHWEPVTQIVLRLYEGYVYSLEVPEAETFVTTGGAIVHNCFPKDVSALKQLAGNSGYHFQLLSAVIEVNELQKRRVVAKLERHLGKLRGKTVALLGLAFKPNTDDMREAPSIVLAGRLIAEGAEVRGWDPVADAAEHLPGVRLCSTALDAVTGADAAVIVTEWPELRNLARPEVGEAMRTPLIVDGRNLLDPERARAAGFVYEGIGRAASPFAALPEAAEPERAQH